MRILVVSDSHGKNNYIRDAVSKSGPFDMLIHAGDLETDVENIKRLVNCPCYFVRGNCDYDFKLNRFEIIKVGEHKIYLIHGHLLSIDFGSDRLEHAALGNGCDVAICGHTHVPQLLEKENITVFNPGSIAKPRQHGRKKTFGIIETDKMGKLHFNIVELDD